MKGKIMVLAGALMLAIAAMAPAAQALVVNVQNGEGNAIESGTPIEFTGAGGVGFISGGSAEYSCREFSLAAEMDENQSDPATMDGISGTIQGNWQDSKNYCYVQPLGLKVTIDGISATGDLTLKPNGTGQLPLQLTEHREAANKLFTWNCTYAGVLPLTWTSSGQITFGNAVFGPVGETGGCAPGNLSVYASGKQLIAAGEPPTLVVE